MKIRNANFTQLPHEMNDHLQSSTENFSADLRSVSSENAF